MLGVSLQTDVCLLHDYYCYQNVDSLHSFCVQKKKKCLHPSLHTTAVFGDGDPVLG